MDDHELASRALAASEDELLTILGAQLTAIDTAHLRDGDVDDLQQRARNWLTRNWDALRDSICSRLAVSAILDDEVLELLAVADIIMDAWLEKSGALTAGAILCKFGLTRLCAGQRPEGLD